MKATDLRIGNLVQSKPLSIPRLNISSDGVMTVTGYGISVIESDADNKLGIEPIPLTDEWLIKLGFEDNSYGQFFKKVSKYSWLVIDVREQKTVQIRENVTIDDHDMDIKCYCVHQLQNLYFALTGKELEATP